MNIFVAGATGAIGKRLVPRLRASGHSITAITRSPHKAGNLSASGVKPYLCDVFDRERLMLLLARLRPHAVIHALTDLPQALDLRKFTKVYAANNHVRREGTRNLVDAAREAGVQRFVVESVASWYAPGGTTWKTEDDALYTSAPEPVGEGVRSLEYMEQLVLASGMEPLVLRYGALYGPGTWFGSGGSAWRQILDRKYPLVGDGSGVYSWIHVDDAAAATVAVLEHASPGIYNVVDDEPAPARDWLPYYAAAIGAKPPRRVPYWLARLLMGGLAEWERTIPGASNARLKHDLGWTPGYANWHQGFREALSNKEPPSASGRPATA